VTHTAIQAPRAFLQVPATNVIDSAHYGYIYCIALLEGTDADGLPDGVQLVTGSGDETIKVRDSAPFCKPDTLSGLLLEWWMRSFGIAPLLDPRSPTYSVARKAQYSRSLHAGRQFMRGVRMGTSRSWIWRPRRLSGLLSCKR
jgi:hypothetical protein